MSPPPRFPRYIGRLAPSPTGFLHLGHLRTFTIAQQRARSAKGSLLLRIEDLDRQRYRPEFVRAIIEDLEWMGLSWEAPIIFQSDRFSVYQGVIERLISLGYLYPCSYSRKDISSAADGVEDEEAIFPQEFRRPCDPKAYFDPSVNWRFRVPDGERIRFTDNHLGPMSFTAGSDFGDFIVWRKSQAPAYELAVVVDDHESQISEVVRGADLIKSTARQILIYRALGWTFPQFYHAHLVCDRTGKPFSKRYDALSIRQLRKEGNTPEDLLSNIDQFALNLPRSVC